MNAVAARVYAFVLLPVVLAAFLFAFRDRGTQAEPSVSVGGRTFAVEIAATDEARAKGLSERDGIADGRGMIFLFDTPGRQGFWMKGMRFAIDIVWLRENRVVHIAREVPTDHVGVIFPDHEADTVLETAAGTLSDVKIGDPVVMSGIR